MRTLTRSVLCLLVAASATGCGTLNGFLDGPLGSGNPYITPNTPPAGTGTATPGGPVVAASGTDAPAATNGTPAGTAVAQLGQPDAPPDRLPAPRPQPGAPGITVPPAPAAWPAGGPLPPTGPAAPAPGMPAPVPPGGIDPHQRAYPTVTGGRLNLGRDEVPTDRVIDLTKHLEVALAQNRDLLARIKELETLGIGREQALAEAMREVDNITAEGVKTRAALQAQILTLQGRIKQLEEEDVFFLRAVIDALEKLLPPEKK